MKHLEQIGESLGVPRGAAESEGVYCRRVAMSALSDWMLTAAFMGERESSVYAVKRLAREKCALFRELMRDAAFYDVQALVDYVYGVLLDNGFFLHRSGYVRPAPRRLIGGEAFALVRGMLPEEDVRFTGLAPWVAQAAQVTDWQTAFDLTELPPEAATDLLWKRGIPAPDDARIDEYLNVERSKGQSYYRAKPLRNVALQLGRTRRSEWNHDYYLLRGREKRRIPENYIEARLHDYVRLDLANRARRQRVYARFDGAGLVYLNFTYLLPRPELRFLRLIAWPDNESSPELDEAWRFCLAREVWLMLRERLEFLHYEVIEEHE